MSKTEQDFVRVRLESPQFDAQALQVKKLSGREAISQPFVFDLELVEAADPPSFDPEAALGKEATIVFEEADEETRRVHGMISEAVDLLDHGQASSRFRVRLVPRAHRLTLVETQEVFLDQTLSTIFGKKLADVGLGAEDVSFRLHDEPAARDLTVQYRETNLAFLSRLAEDEGIWFRFEHQGGKDVLVFGDGNEAFRPISEAPIAYATRGSGRLVFQVESFSSMFPASYAVKDYDDQHPRLDMLATAGDVTAFGGQVVEYGAFHLDVAHGKRLAAIHADERRALASHLRGKSGYCELTAGGTFVMEGHPRLEGERLVVVEVLHEVVQNVLLHGADDAEPAVRYTNSFRATRASQTYRPPRVTPRPRIHGFLHAITEAAPAGASGRVAQIDEQGRYTVRFFFDMASARGRTVSSCAVRMMQPHAGPNYGFHFPLKPDVEVLVAFLDGDPDRPVIAGAVPNPLTQSPVTQRNSLMNRIETESGIYITMKDR